MVQSATEEFPANSNENVADVVVTPLQKKYYYGDFKNCRPQHAPSLVVQTSAYPNCQFLHSLIDSESVEAMLLFPSNEFSASETDTRRAPQEVDGPAAALRECLKSRAH